MDEKYTPKELWQFMKSARLEGEAKSVRRWVELQIRKDKAMCEAESYRHPNGMLGGTADCKGNNTQNSRLRECARPLKFVALGDHLDEYLHRIMRVMEAATEGMTVAEFVAQQSGRWSTVEIVEHLSLACNGTSKLLEWCANTGKLINGRPSEKQRIMTSFVIDGEEFLAGQVAPAFAVPRGIDPEGALRYLEGSLIRLDKAVSRCTQIFGVDATLGRHAVLGPLTGKQWCKFHWVHTAHHVKQIEEIKRWLGA